jgi:hypothetical protein
VGGLGPTVRRAAVEQPLDRTRWGWPDPSTTAGLTVGVSVGEGGGSIWEIGTVTSGRRAVLGHAAAWDARHAVRLALWHLPVHGGALAAPALGARLLWRQGGGLRAVVDGPSFGGAFVLAAASALLDLPVPSDLVASVAVSLAGDLGPVGAVAEKSALLAATGRRWRLLVHPDDAVVARAAGDGAVEVVPVGRPSELFERAFGDVTAALAERWRTNPAAAEAAADALYRVALHAHAPILSWKAVAQSCEALATCVDGARLERVEMAQGIASRHAGAARLLSFPASEALTRMSRPVRLRHLAHVVQSAADVEDAPVLEWVQAALEWVRPEGERSAEDWVLLGAAGRALASVFAYAEAAARLQDAVDGWLAAHEVHEASHPVCELLRVQALLGDAAGVTRAWGHAEAVLADPRSTDLSRFHVLNAGLRAFTLADDLSRAAEIGARADVDWQTAPTPLRRTHQRWAARAGLAVEPLSVEGESDLTGLLARIDRARAAGEDLTPLDVIVREFAARTGGLDRLLAEAPPGELAKFVADNYRY